MLMIDYLLGLIAPHACVGCGADGPLLCAPCSRSLPVADRRCYRCGTPNASFATCPACRNKAPLRAVYAAARYDGLARDLVWRLKFDRAQAAAGLLARRMAAVLPVLPADALVVPVPTARSRVRRRGYDQAVLLARAYAEQTGRPYTPLLRRLGRQDQIGASRAQRRQQLESAYGLLPVAGGRFRGRPVVLVDDVLTTGATLEAAARLLVGAGAGPVHGLVFAQV